MCYDVSMIRTQIQLPEQDYRHLQEAARRRGSSMAQCIREAVGLFLRSEKRGFQDVSEIPAFHVVSGRPLKEHDQAWADSIASKKLRSR